jgi:hypothetical protein
MDSWTDAKSDCKRVRNLFKQYDLEDFYENGMTWNQALNILYDHPRVIKQYVKEFLREHGMAHLYFEGMHRQQAWRIVSNKK